jgi:hypothetical protein
MVTRVHVAAIKVRQNIRIGLLSKEMANKDIILEYEKMD